LGLLGGTWVYDRYYVDPCPEAAVCPPTTSNVIHIEGIKAKKDGQIIIAPIQELQAPPKDTAVIKKPLTRKEKRQLKRKAKQSKSNVQSN
jgi:hypothetical protein